MTHRVLQVRMTLIDEATGEIFARKGARIHENDLPAGKMLLVLKSQEILIDALAAFNIYKPDGMKWSSFADSKFERTGKATS